MLLPHATRSNIAAIEFLRRVSKYAVFLRTLKLRHEPVWLLLREGDGRGEHCRVNKGERYVEVL